MQIFVLCFEFNQNFFNQIINIIQPKIMLHHSPCSYFGHCDPF